LALATSALVLADDWPDWRGPKGDSTTGEVSHWNGQAWGPPRELWRIDVGAGGTSPLVIDGKLYVAGWREGQDTVYCFDAASGAEIWKQSYAAPQYGRQAVGEQGLYSGMSATPKFDPETGYLYTVSLDGDLNCWDTAAQGANVWRLNYYDAYAIPRRPRVARAQQRDYGYSGTPLVHGDWVVAEVGSAEEGTLMAFDKRTGQRVWTSQAKEPAGHTAGLVAMTVEGVPCAAVFTLRGLLVARLDAGHEGETVAWREWETNYGQNTTTVSVVDQFALITSEYNHNRIAKLEITLSGAREVWIKDYSSKVCVPVVHEGHVYWAWREMFCLDFATGELKWRGGTHGDAGSCIVTSDGRLIVWSGAGNLTLVESAQRSPDRYTPLATIEGIGAADAWPHLALAENRLYCKDRNGRLVCLEFSPAP
jgi:outer membrane protein assembly factor BamB